jgi:outer membrane protein W
MLRKGIAVAALSICGMAAVVGTASTAKAVDNPWELTLSASAVNSGRFNDFEASGTLGVGYYLTDNWEIRAQQTVSYSDFVPGTSLDASTRLAVDYNIPLGDHGQWVPFVGANIGYDYGKGVRDTWEAAPEAGVKFYVNNTTFIYGDAEYQFFFSHGNSVGNGFKEGQFVYSVGIGFRL